MAITGNTQLGPTKQDLIAAVVQRELKFNAKIVPYVTDVSQYAKKGMKSIAFPKLGSFTVEKRVSGATGTPQVLVATNDVLDLNQNAYVSWLIDSTDELQSSIEANMEFSARAAKAHARQVDLDIFIEAKAVAGFNAVAGAITRDKILDMREYILDNEGNLGQMALFIPVDQEKAMLKIDEFTRAEVYGQPVIPNGMIGRVYGMPVVMHNGLDNGEVFMWDKEGLAVGFQKAPAYGSQSAIEYGVGSTLEAIDQLYGVQGMQIAQGDAAAGKSALVAGMWTP